MMRNWFILILLIITYLLYFSIFDAMGVIFDTRLLVVILSFALLFISAYLTFRYKKLHFFLYVTLSLFILGLSIKEKYFTYDEEEINFKSDGLTFYGTLYSPKFKEADCLVVFIHGSGTEDRKEYAFHARQLARNGVAGFAYDKRGSGKSGGDTYEVGYYGYAKDAVAATDKIKSQRSFFRTGFFAVSEGEWVSLIADSLMPVDFIVMVSASGTSPLIQTLREMTYRLGRKEFSQEAISEAADLYHEILTYNGDSINRSQIEGKIAKAKNEPWFEAGEDFSEELFYYPWWYNVMNFNPSQYLSETSAEILVLTGEQNQSYPPEETLKNFEKYPNVEVVIFKNGDHSLLNWKFGKGVPPPFFTDGYLKTYTDWMLNSCSKKE